MSVFKEGFQAVQTIKANSSQVFVGECFIVGAPVKAGDSIWATIQTLAEYKMPEDPVYKGEEDAWFEVSLIREGLVSDGELTVEEATVTFRVEYNRLRSYNKNLLNPQFIDKDAFVTVYQKV